MAWLVPENMLDDQQRQFVENVDIDRQNVWIKGFPGSGKSVLLAYTMKKIKQRSPQSKVVVVVYTHALIAMFRAAFSEMGIAATIITYPDFQKGYERYDYILCDEVQDLREDVLRSMYSRAKHVIVAGDENQSIYEDTVLPSQIGTILDARNFELQIIHRLSSSIIAAVEKFLPNLNIFSAKRDMTKSTTQIRLCTSTSSRDEIKYIVREAERAVNVGDTAAILIPTHDSIMAFFQEVLANAGKNKWTVQLNRFGKVDYEQLNKYLGNQGIKMQYVGNKYGSFISGTNKICVMTYHSSKGLDFDNVFMPGLNQSLYITPNELLNRVLFMVAMTRSRKNLYLTHSGTRSAYLSNFVGECSKINIHDALNGQTVNASGGNIFGI